MKSPSWRILAGEREMVRRVARVMGRVWKYPCAVAARQNGFAFAQFDLRAEDRLDAELDAPFDRKTSRRRGPFVW